MSDETRRRRSAARRSSEERPSIIVELSLDVPVSKKTLFEYLANLENNPEWNWAVRSVTSLQTADPARGARYSQHRAAGGDETDLLEITEYEPDEQLEIKGVVGEGHVAYRHHLVGLTSRSTRLCTGVELVPGEPVARPDLYAARLVAAVSANLEMLRSQLVNRTSAGSASRSGTT